MGCLRSKNSALSSLSSENFPFFLSELPSDARANPMEWSSLMVWISMRPRFNLIQNFNHQLSFISQPIFMSLFWFWMNGALLKLDNPKTPRAQLYVPFLSLLFWATRSTFFIFSVENNSLFSWLSAKNLILYPQKWINLWLFLLSIRWLWEMPSRRYVGSFSIDETHIRRNIWYSLMPFYRGQDNFIFTDLLFRYFRYVTYCIRSFFLLLIRPYRLPAPGKHFSSLSWFWSLTFLLLFHRSRVSL